MAVRFSEKEYQALVGEPSVRTASRNKYRNVKCELDGITFDSARERDRYAELKMLERSGQIQNLVLQPSFEIVPPVIEDGKVVQRAVTYRADFSYMQDDEIVVEDAKGVLTDVYKLKKKLMRSVYGIKVREV